MRRGFTIVQLLVVLAIIALLAAILFPVFAKAKVNTKAKACLARQRQLGQALALYANDQEDRSPVSTPRFFRGAPLGIGWAGAIYPYVKDVDAFRCGSDETRAASVAGGKTPEVVSYGLNINLSRLQSNSEASDPTRSVQTFEVAGNLADITLPDEGASKGPTVTGQFSCIGDGTYGGILASTEIWTGPGQGRFTRYATGEIDNAGSPEQGHGDDYQGEPSRHTEGSNWLAIDTHVVWLPPKAVSAGMSAKNASDPQRIKGCSFLRPDITEFACAEGSAVGKHRLTFSVR